MQNPKLIFRNLLHFDNTNNELSEINKTIPFKIVLKNKIPRNINFTKEVNDLYSENYKTLMKETEDDTNQWKDIPCLEIRRINIVKMSRASLVAQWLRICLLMQGTRVRALVWEDPTCRGAARPVSHNY